MSRTSEQLNRTEADASTLKSKQRQLSRTRKTDTTSDKTIGRSQLLNGIIVPDVERENSKQPPSSSINLETTQPHNQLIKNTSTGHSQ